MFGGSDGFSLVRLGEAQDIPFGNDADEKRLGFGLGGQVEDDNVTDFVFFHELEEIANGVVQSKEPDLSCHNIGCKGHGREFESN